jgi:hypothetical protein
VNDVDRDCSRRRRSYGRLGKLVTLAAVTAAAVLATPAQAFALSSVPDSTWQVDGKTYALATNGTTLFVGGKFNRLLAPAPTVGKFQAKNIAAVDMSTGAPVTTWHVSVTGTTVSPMVETLKLSPDGSTLYIGGYFDAVNGVPRSNVAAVDVATGAVIDSFAPNVGNKVHVMLMGSDRLYFGGSFQKVDGQTRNFLASVLFDGTLTSWAPNANDNVRSLAFAPDGNTIFVGGHFTQMNGASRQSVARVSTTTGANDAWAIPAGVINTPQTAWALIPRGNRLYGGFGKGPNYLAVFRLDNGTSGTQVWRFNTVGNVESLALSADGTQLYAGGHFGTGPLNQTVCGNLQLRGLMLLNPATGAINCSWLPQLAPTGSNFKGGWTMLLTDTQLWVGGLFTSVSGATQESLARFTL